jgi:hypothetical protein
MNNLVQLTRISSDFRMVKLAEGEITTKSVGKRFTFKDNKLDYETLGTVSTGVMDRIEVNDLEGLGAVITGLKTSQCLCYGVTDFESIKLMSDDVWEKKGRPDNARPRTQNFMHWPTGRAVLMLDYDPPKDGLAKSGEELIAAVRGLHPEIAAADCLHYWSSSSFVQAGGQNTGPRGQRIYFILDKGIAAEQIMEAIHTLSWAQKLGRWDVSAAGSLLDRGLLDRSVVQPQGVDYCAGAVLTEGVTQDRGLPTLLKGSRGGDFIAGNILPLPEEITRLAAQNRELAKAEKATEAQAVKQAYSASRIEHLVAQGSDRKAAQEAVKAATETQYLLGDWELVIKARGGIKTITVRDVLNDREKYNGTICKDPIEPDYDGGRWVGKIYADVGGARLYSQAHGGATYLLCEKEPVVKKQARPTIADLYKIQDALIYIHQDFKTAQSVARALGALNDYMEAGLARKFWDHYRLGSSLDAELFDQYAGKDYEGRSIGMLLWLSWAHAAEDKTLHEQLRDSGQAFDAELLEAVIDYLTKHNQLPESLGGAPHKHITGASRHV